MAHVAGTQVHSLNTGISHAVFSAVSNALKYFARNAAYKSTVAELDKLSDKELSDIGISRGEIHYVAKQGAMAV